MAWSDSDDGSGEHPIARADFVTWLGGIRPLPTTFSAFVDQGEGCGRAVGSEYIATTKGTDGMLSTICHDACADRTPDMAAHMARLEREFTQSATPDLDTLEVSAQRGEEVVQHSLAYHYAYVEEHNTIAYLAAPNRGSTITVSYCPRE